jgi:preprotein translocase subunit SecB
MSLEQPNSPEFAWSERKRGRIQLGVDAMPVSGRLFEVTVTATVHTKIGENGVSGSRPNKRYFSKSAT